MRASIRFALACALLAAAGAYVLLNPPAKLELSAGTLASLPTEFDGWESVDLSFEDVVYEELEADDTLVRRYSNAAGESVWFVIIFHQNRRYGAHDPEICYESHAWAILDRGLLKLSRDGGGFDANVLLVERAGSRRLVLNWWYTAGDLATADRDRFMSRMASSGIKENVTFGAFIRASTEVLGDDVDAAGDVLRRFCESLLPHLPGLFDLEQPSDR